LIRGLIIRRKFRLPVCPGRSNSLNPAHILAVYAVAWVGANLAAGVAGIWYRKGSPEWGIIGGIGQFLLGLPAGLVVASFFFNGGAVRGMGLTPRRWLNDSVRGVIAFLAVWPVCILLLRATEWVLRHLAPHLLRPHQLLKALSESNLHVSWQVLVILSAVVLAPLAEEVFFRGLLQSMLRRYLRSPWAAILVASLFFAAAHWSVLPSLPALFVLSLALGYSYERTGRLHAPIMIHSIFNAVSIIETLNHPGGGVSGV